MKKLYICTRESSTGGEPESDEKWCHHSDIIMTVEFLGVTREKPDGFFPCESMEVSDEIYDAERIYLVIPRYYSGGTFGRTCGYWCVEGVFKTPEEAEALAKAIRGKNYNSKSRGYLPWVGYFEGLEDVEIHSFPIRNSGVSSAIRYHM